MSVPSQRRPLLAKFVHIARVMLVVALLLAIPSPASRSVSDGSVAPTIDKIDLDQFDLDDKQTLQIEPDSDSGGMWRVIDADGKPIASVARTLPAAKQVVGYRGPTEAALVVSPDRRIVSVQLLGSADTPEHVKAVIDDKAFFRQFQDWSWGQPPSGVKVEGVSGATLTSLALAEGVILRMSGTRASLLFPEPISVDDVSPWFPDAVAVDPQQGRAVVQDQSGNTLGHVLQTGPLADHIIGYQGPTEMMIKLSPDDTVEAVRIRKSFDNEPYVDYVRTERGFWALFTGRSLQELAQLDPQAERIEGVSGATMTSIAVADTLVAAAAAAQRNADTEHAQPPPWATIRWTAIDVATIITLLLAVFSRRLGWFGNHTLRRVWLVLVIAVIGLWTGNLVSMALVAGWSAEGIPWRLAPGLAAITVTALLVPPLAKANPYCNHLCPHGAIQQLIKPGPHSRRRWRPSPAVIQRFKRLPGLTLVVAYLALLAMPTIDLSSWEPFHAYLFRIAGWGSIVLAIASLGVAAVIPMGYCRLGCPTGRLIEYLRRTATSDRIISSDIVALGLLAIALAVQQLDR